VPLKIRQLISALEKAGFENRGGKGSYRNYIHPEISTQITLSGKSGDDAKIYQVRMVEKAISETEN
jgi:predicted RNA binding protein YcfA (HicA-like mRNA interferase family)